MYAQLGNIRFEGQRGFNSLEETFGVEYVQHARIKNKPRLERTGETLDTVSFEMRLHSQFTDPEADIEALRVAMKNGEILPFILGNGKFVGHFVIPSFTKSTEFTDADGNLISVTLSVELLEVFSSDPLRQALDQLKKNAFATENKNSNVRAILPPVASPATALATEVAKIETSEIRLNQHAAAIEGNSSTSGYYSGKINDTLGTMENSITKIQGILSESTDLSNGAQKLPDSLQGVYTAIQNIKATLPVTNITELKSLLNNMKQAVISTQLANTDNSNQSIIRRK
jgi:phage protein U